MRIVRAILGRGGDGQNYGPESRRGVALILTLSFIVLLTAMIVAFFATTSNTRRETSAYEAGVEVKQLADIATNIVIGQISDATKSWEVPPPPPVPPSPALAGKGARLTYSTQPGMIRTYDDQGNPGRAFKLYSSATMVTPPGTDWIASAQLATEVPSDWPAMPALYTDLNAPVLRPDPAGTITIGSSGTKYSATYPILDPSALSATPASSGSPKTDGVDGFDLTNVPGFGGPQSFGRPNISAGYNPLSAPGVTAGTTGNPAPMPVQWIYVLQDGTLTSPPASSPDGLSVDWSGPANGTLTKPRKANPIVGRIAFWTDDETCKLNINVNSEGTYWDRAWAVGDMPASPFGENQLRDRVPVKGEYERYPGHPAMTCLSAVFGFLPGYLPPTGNTVAAGDYNGPFAKYYSMIPRVGPKDLINGPWGTKAGTLSSSDTKNPLAPITVDSDRLYASVDELAFDPARSTTGRLQPSDIEHVKFFLTANGRCAEVTSFNTPRVLLWQLQQASDPNGSAYGGPARPRNAKDELLAFCGTVNSFPFYFQRYSIYQREPTNNRLAHPTVPFKQLPEFGYAAPPSSQRPFLDWQIQRNQDIYKYLQNLTASPIPGIGGKLTSKYPAAVSDQILTEMVDLIRMGTNSYAADPQVPPRYEYAPARQMPDAVSGETMIVPLVPQSGVPGDGTKGFGRFPTITEAALIFYASHDVKGTPDKMRVLLVLQPYSATAGSWTWSPLVRYVVKGLDGLMINGQKSLFRPNLVNLLTGRCGYGSGSNHNTAYTGTFAAFRYWGGSGTDNTKMIRPSGTASFNEETDYPFVSDEIPIDPKSNNGKFAFGGGDLAVEVHAGYALAPSATTLVQTINLHFTPGTWPLPRSSGAAEDFNTRIGTNVFNLVNAADTVRSLQVDPNGPTFGDLRMVSAQKVVPSNYYAGYAGGADGPGYNSSEAPIVHSIRNGESTTLTGGIYHANLFDGRYGTPTSSSGNPIAPRGLKVAAMSTGILGDWDNGPNGFQDGCYVNKPDDYYGTQSTGDWWSTPVVTPNKQIASPVVFGSLPVGSSMNPVQPWRTLLFCANPPAGSSHPGFAKPHDHAFLDFFTMPVVEPYAISEPFSTAGKVNLNYQIAPFTYIRRATAMHGVLKSVRLTAIPNSAMATYKGSGVTTVLRPAIDPIETLKAFDQRFDGATNGAANGGMFRSASEICDMALVPKGATLNSIRGGWWSNYALTGDNAREIPYGHIYSRVTTKSNTFTVHFVVQTLAKRRTSDPNDSAQWHEVSDAVTGEYRGSTLIERYVDLGDTMIPDFAKQPNATLDPYYKFRIVSTKKFMPNP